MMKRFVKQCLHKVAPRSFGAFQAIRARRYVQKLQVDFGLNALEDTLFKSLPLKTIYGPFRGMSWNRDKISGSLIPLVIGCYEMELWSTLEEIIAGTYQQVIDVGCAEGYYAVGLALRMPDAQVQAFDIDPWSRKVCGRLAELNDVATRVHLNGECSREGLQELLTIDSFVLCDCEGYEFELLRPDLLPRLLIADYLVELHDGLASDRVKKLLANFERTHSAKIIEAAERDPAMFPELNILCVIDQRRAISEHRATRQHWIWLKKRSA